MIMDHKNSTPEKRRRAAALFLHALMLLLITALLLSACGNTVPSAEAPEETPSEARTEESTAQRTEETEEPSELPESRTEERTEAPTEESSEESTEEPTETVPETTKIVPPETMPKRDPDTVIDLSTTLYTYDKMCTDLQYLSENYPERMTLETAGVTADGRPLYAAYFGNRNASRSFFICAATHGREYMTAQLVMKQLEYYCAHYTDGSYNGVPFSTLFQDTLFVIVPMVNPDGVTVSQLGEDGIRREDLKNNLRSIYASDLANGFTSYDYPTYLTRWKANLLGVDLNRNFSPGWETVRERSVPSADFFKGNEPGDQAEAQALMQLVNGMTSPRAVISYHSYGDLVYWQYGQPEPLWTANQNLAQHISNLTGHYLAGYSNEAGFTNWCIIERKIPAVVVETGTVPTPLPLDQFAPLFEKHRYMWAMLASLY